MTAKQTDFIKTLIAERETASLSPDQQQYLARVYAGHANPGVEAASRIISKLLSLPRRGEAAAIPGVAAPADPSAEVVPAGRYAIVDEADGRIRFFVVDRPEEGRWAGRVFVSEQASDEKFPVRGARRGEVLAAIAEDPRSAMIRYGHELGRCGNCGRTLTDETSRAMGIGPDCARQLGIDRTPASERARAEAAARVRGPYEKTTAPAETLSATLSVEDEAGEDSPADVPAAPENAAHAAGDSFSALRAAAGRQDPSKALGWRERRARVAEQQGRENATRPATSSQITTLPGTTWEDIFNTGVGA